LELYLIGKLDLVTSDIMPVIRDRHKSTDFIDFFKMVDQEYSDASVMKIVLDNHSVTPRKRQELIWKAVLEDF
jgi:hypothetical protein